MTTQGGKREEEGIPHPSEMIDEELAARGWDKFDLATRMGGDPIRNLLVLDMYWIVGPKRTNCRIGDVTAHQLGVAFDVSHEFFLNLEAAWLGQAARPPLALDSAYHLANPDTGAKWKAFGETPDDRRPA